MQELINIKNDEAVTTSLLVAEMFEKRHSNVIRGKSFAIAIHTPRFFSCSDPSFFLLI